MECGRCMATDKRHKTDKELLTEGQRVCGEDKQKREKGVERCSDEQFKSGERKLSKKKTLKGKRKAEIMNASTMTK